ncbi:MAG: hypothetical protein IKY62_00915 [Clostridia bacterium]|nr:hypothetical protein [Clostridia bacterium]
MYGRTFYYPAEKFHAMKIFEVKDEDELAINAVDLESGTLFFVGACEEVIPTICSLHIVE